MAVNLSPIGGVAGQFFDNNGDPLTGGKIYTYAAGTTTPQATYTSATGTTPHSNPIILDAAGRVPSGEIWLTDGAQYKFVIKTSTDVQIGSYDNIIGINSNFVNYTNSQEIQTATAGQTVFTLTTMQYQPATNSLSVFVDGVNQYGPGSTYAYEETSSTVVTFASGLHVGAQVKFTTSAINASSYGDAEQISYTPPFTNGVATNVELKLAQYVSVKDFGAVGDGVANDTTAIQNAINYAAPLGRSVFIPAGIYNVTTLTLPLQQGGIEIFGEAFNSYFNLQTSIYRGSVLISNVTTGNVISCDGGVNYSNRGIRLRNFSLKVDTIDYAIYLKGSPDLNLLENLTIYNTNPSGGNGIALESCWLGARVFGCQIDAAVVGTSNVGLNVFNAIKAGGLSIEDTNINFFYKNLVIGNDVYQAHIRNASLQSGGYGCVIEGNDPKVYLNTCHFEFNSDNAIYIKKSNGVTVNNCTFYRNAESASSIAADIFVDAGGLNYNYNLNVENCLNFGLSSNTYFMYVSNTSFGSGSIFNNRVTILAGATNTFGLYLDASSAQYFTVDGNLFESTATPYVNATLASSFKKALNGQNSIRFDANPDPSTNPNTLDFYAETTFTPNPTGTGGGTATIVGATGFYQRVGATVHFTAYVQWSAMAGRSGNLIINNLPFTARDISAGNFACSVFANGLAIGAGSQLMAVVLENTTNIAFYEYNPSTGNTTPVTAPASGTVSVSGAYVV